MKTYEELEQENRELQQRIESMASAMIDANNAYQDERENCKESKIRLRRLIEKIPLAIDYKDDNKNYEAALRWAEKERESVSWQVACLHAREERDEARSERDAALKKLAHIEADNKFLHERRGQVCIERDKSIAECSALRKALSEAADLAWDLETRDCRLDDSIVFGKGYDFYGLENLREEIHTSIGSAMVWPDGPGKNKKWSAYCEHEGALWFEKFSTKQDAKNVIIDYFNHFIPDHPACVAKRLLDSKK